MELSDGHLHFSEKPLRSSVADVPLEGEEGTLSYQEAVDVLGFSLEDALAQLPERLRFSEEHLEKSVFYLSENHSVYGGYAFEIIGEKYPEGLHPKLIFCYQHKGEQMNHEDWTMFRVVPWERLDVTRSEQRAWEEYGIREYYYKSLVGDIEVGLLHSNTVFDAYPEMPSEYYYAGFYVGDMGYALESHLGYCTQEEFIQVILDAEVAAQ